MSGSRNRLALLVVAFCLAMATGSATADVTLTDLNSEALFDFESSDGLWWWEVDERNHMYQQWFWYRLGATGGEESIDALPMAGPPVLSDANGDGDDDSVVATYLGPGFTIDLTFVLTGSLAGSGESNMLEIIEITNTSVDDLDFHFFQYTDFDLNDYPFGDTVEITGGNTAIQTKGGVYVAETVVTSQPSHHQVDWYEEDAFQNPLRLLGDLEDDQPTQLNDQSGPLEDVDAVWAFEWDETIPGDGGTAQISKNKHIIPEPASLTLMGGGVVLALIMRQRRR